MVFLLISLIVPITASYIGGCHPLLFERGKVSTTLTTRVLSFSLRGYYNISIVSLLALPIYLSFMMVRDSASQNSVNLHRGESIPIE